MEVQQQRHLTIQYKGLPILIERAPAACHVKKNQIRRIK